MLERQKSALEATLTKLQLDHPDITRALQSEAEAREKCEEAREQLRRYEAIYGSAALASAGPDVQSLAEQLRSKDDELRKTRLELKALQEVWPMLDIPVQTLIVCAGTISFIHRNRTTFCSLGEP